MYSLECLINKSDSRIRKHWLLSTFSLFILIPISLSCFWAILSFIMFIPLVATIEPLIYAIIGLSQGALIWHCAYKKYGTKLLTAWLIIFPLNQLRIIPEIFIDPPANWFNGAIILLEIAIFIWWYIMSIKLRAINMTVKKRLSTKKALQLYS